MPQIYNKSVQLRISLPLWSFILVNTEVFQITSKSRHSIPCNCISDLVYFYFPTVHWAPACITFHPSLYSLDYSTGEQCCHVCLQCSPYGRWHMTHTSGLSSNSNESFSSLSRFNHALVNAKTSSFSWSLMVWPLCSDNVTTKNIHTESQEQKVFFFPHSCVSSAHKSDCCITKKWMSTNRRLFSESLSSLYFPFFNPIKPQPYFPNYLLFYPHILTIDHVSHGTLYCLTWNVVAPETVIVVQLHCKYI